MKLAIASEVLLKHSLLNMLKKIVAKQVNPFRFFAYLGGQTIRQIN